MSQALEQAQDLARASACDWEEKQGLHCLVPDDPQGLAQVLSEARARQQRIMPMGAGTQLTWCRPDAYPGSIDGSMPPIPISLRRLTGIVEQIPGEGTITAQAGTPWNTLSEAVKQSGERLPGDLGCAQESTLGGVLASGRSGPDRMRHGPLRHHLLGMQVMLTDGTRAKSGGRLVKNVTGFDLHRLYAGSRGTLVFILEASLRLMAEPQKEWSFSLTVSDCAQGFALALELQKAMPRLRWLVLRRTGNGFSLAGGLSGSSLQVEADKALVLTTLSETPETFEEDSSDHRQRVVEAGSENLAVWQVDAPLGLGAPVLSALEKHLPAATNVWVDCSAGRILVARDESGTAEVMPQWSDEIRALGARLRPLCASASCHQQLVDPSPEIRSWSNRLTKSLDPTGILTSSIFPWGAKS